MTCHDQCPLCGEENACQVARGDLYKGDCWCHRITVPAHLLSQLADNFTTPACLCRPCLEAIATLAREGGSVETVLEEARAQVLARLSAREAANAPDFYLDEFGNTVFTAAYHLKRGNCCGNQCRHCPY